MSGNKHWGKSGDFDILIDTIKKILQNRNDMKVSVKDILTIKPTFSANRSNGALYAQLRRISSCVSSELSSSDWEREINTSFFSKLREKLNVSGFIIQDGKFSKRTKLSSKRTGSGKTRVNIEELFKMPKMINTMSPTADLRDSLIGNGLQMLQYSTLFGEVGRPFKAAILTGKYVEQYGARARIIYDRSIREVVLKFFEVNGIQYTNEPIFGYYNVIGFTHLDDRTPEEIAYMVKYLNTLISETRPITNAKWFDSLTELGLNEDPNRPLQFKRNKTDSFKICLVDSNFRIKYNCNATALIRDDKKYAKYNLFGPLLRLQLSGVDRDDRFKKAIVPDGFAFDSQETPENMVRMLDLLNSE